MSNLKVIILAAGMGSRLRPLSNDKPKCMIKLLNETLIQRQVKIFHSCNINEITVVTGYKSEVMKFPHPRSIEAIENLAIQRGVECSLKKAEAFQLIRNIID